MTGFQRAHSQEQRAIRRRQILDTAADMLGELPVSQVSLNELSRRVGLAKSNVLRYFESREAVLLELLDSASGRWLAELDGTLDTAIDPTAPLARRSDQLAAALAESLARQPILCDLISAQAAVLERNVSPQVAAQYKRSAIGHIGAFAALIRQKLPELDEAAATGFTSAVILVVGSIWTHSQPSAAMLAAYQAEPELARLRIDFTTATRQTLEVLLTGVLARSGNPDAVPGSTS